MCKNYDLKKIGKTGDIYVPNGLKYYKSQDRYCEALERFVDNSFEIVKIEDISILAKDKGIKREFIKALNALSLDAQKIAAISLEWHIGNLKNVIIPDSMEYVIGMRYTSLLDQLELICNLIRSAEIDEAKEQEDDMLLKKILVIDNTPNIISEVKVMVEGKYKIYGETCYKTALEFLEGQHVDAILLEIEIDEFSFIENIRSIPGYEKIPIILATVYANLEYLQSAFKLGISDLIIKPLESKGLLTRLERYFS